MAFDYNSLEQYRHRTPARIPQGFATSVMQSDYSLSQTKALCSFFSLKVAVSSGVLIDYKKHKQQLATYLDCKETTLRLRLNFLIKIGLAKVEYKIKSNRKIPYLYLTSYEKAREILKDVIPGQDNIKKKNTKSIPIINKPKLYESLQAAAINDNFRKQKFKVIQRIVNIELNCIGIHQISNFKKNSAERKQYSRIKKSVTKHFAFYCNKYKRDKFSLLNNNQNNNLSTDITLSCKGVGKIFNSKANNGYNIIKNLKNQNLITTKKRLILMPQYNNYCYQSFLNLQKQLPSNERYKLVFSNNKVFVKLSNKILINNNGLFRDKDISLPIIPLSLPIIPLSLPIIPLSPLSFSR